ncbi:MAG TPA: amylo-alpha-1,6-glucosidase [Steroidobacteraceae bacterium]|nr:amylo-alpha-1,6-glucosidase [Steroidobacteraceae bacterium]
MILSRSTITHATQALSREWLVTNGIGGFASGTVSQANTRRYHGLLVASLRPPVERVLMVAKIEAGAAYRGEYHALGCNEFADGTLSPRGFELLSGFRLEQQVPVWTYAFNDAVLEQRIWMADGQNTAYASFSLVAGSAPVDLELTPLCTYRDYHSHTRGGWPLEIGLERCGCRITAFAGARSYRVLADRGEFSAAPDWYWSFRHREEAERGLDATEDLFRPGVFRVRLAPGEAVTCTASAEDLSAEDPAHVLARSVERKQSLLGALPTDTPDWVRQLTLAADQFIVGRAAVDAHGTARLEEKTVIAGYPWFSDWGRDTMIALPGLALASGRTADAAAILRTFARHTSQGMLPNRFPDGGEAPEYNTVDAGLWYFHAVASYLDATDDQDLLRDLYPTLKDIISWHRRGTRYSIKVDPADGLLRAGEPGVQLTWMDAKVGDWVVTPRSGKAVEINALWHFALTRMAQWAALIGDTAGATDLASAAARVAHNFGPTFWFEEGGYLYDVVDGPDGPTDARGRRVDTSLRPNQIFAVALGTGLLDADRARAVVDTCARELLTPVGLRSLSPRDSRYAGIYQGGPAERDAVYHQGTVWSWLLGPFVLAHWHVYRDRNHAMRLLAAIAAHLGEGCLGTISEILDGSSPHTPRGCFAQAWSVSETLRAWHFLRSVQ